MHVVVNYPLSAQSTQPLSWTFQEEEFLHTVNNTVPSNDSGGVMIQTGFNVPCDSEVFKTFSLLNYSKPLVSIISPHHDFLHFPEQKQIMAPHQAKRAEVVIPLWLSSAWDKWESES